MADVITTVSGLPLAIKAGWLIWMAWAAAQALWYRRARVAGSVAHVPVAPAARRRPEARPDPRPEPRPEPRPVRQEAAAPSAPPEPAFSLPSIDLSDIVAAAERSASADAGTSRVGGSILGLESRP